MKKICVITGTRAEYGILNRLMHLINDDNELSLQIIVTNMHLSPEFGLTYREIEADGFTINKKVEMLLSSDTPNAITKSVGLAVIGFADAIEDLKPDLIIVLGDRFEILAAVTASLFYKIPVAHLHGGEITEGAFDNSIRHAITKMSHLHFTSTEEYRKRVIQMGENPEDVFNVGALGCENITSMKLMGKDELEKSMNFAFDRKTILVTFHPETLESISAKEQFEVLLEAISGYRDLRVIFTMPNSDTDGRIIINMITQFVEKNQPQMIWFHSLGAIRYLSVLQYIGAVVGNSSSSIIEVPSFHIPTINIGNRQKGRIAAKSVINCKLKKEDIQKELNLVLNDEYRRSLVHIKNPYYKLNTAQEILNIIKHRSLSNIIKKFHTIN